MHLKYKPISKIEFNYETIPLKPVGVLMVVGLMISGRFRRILRFIKREAIASRDLFITTLFLLFCCALIILVGLLIHKYKTVLDGVWDMKSVFLTTTALGLFTLVIRDTELWRERLKNQRWLLLDFGWQSEQLSIQLKECILDVSGEDEASDSELNSYLDPDTLEVSEEINTDELERIIDNIYTFLSDFLEEIGNNSVAVEQQNITATCQDLRKEIVQYKKNYDYEEDVSNLKYIYASMVNQFSFINDSLIGPWVWDIKRDNCIRRIITKYATIQLEEWTKTDLQEVTRN